MKPLALAIFCVLPALAQAQVMSGPASPTNVPPVPVLGRPALYVRFVKGPAGYALGDLVKNLDWTQKNLNGLLNYLNPYDGSSPPTGADAASAQKDLLSESAACATLIADGHAALARGIPRDPQDPMLRGVLGFAMRAQFVSKNPSLERLQRNVASNQVNVAGQMSALIQAKRFHTPDEKEEKEIQKWLDSARKNLAAAEQHLARAREKGAGEGARKAGKKAFGAATDGTTGDPPEPCVVEEGAALPANLRGPCYTK